MIQRLQSIYLLLSTAAGILCLLLPIGNFILEDLPFAEIRNLWISIDGAQNYTSWPLFAILALATFLSSAAILLFKKRALQMRLCTFSIILLVGWYAYYSYMGLTADAPLQFRPTVWASLPFVMIVFNYLAFRGILKDELLIRSLDRLR